MMKKELNKRLKIFSVVMATLLMVVVFLILGVLYLQSDNSLPFQIKEEEEKSVPEKMVQVEEDEEIAGGVHVGTGLVAGEGLNLVIANCTGCHSAQLITQNRATEEGWVRVIRWMQETQNLWELGENEEAIVDYLAKYYAPEKKGRRAPLSDIEWYELEE